MRIKSSFRYYKSFGAYIRNFDRPLLKWQFISISILFKILKITYLYKLIQFIFDPKIFVKVLQVTDIATFVFTNNHRIIYELFYKLGFEFPVYNFSENKIKCSKGSTFSWKLIFFASIMNIDCTINELKNAKSDELLFSNTIRIIKLCGLEYIYKTVLKYLKVIVKFNDHGPDAVLLSDMAEENNVKTVYIQHAPVSEKFPPLYHDLNVLFSEDSFKKYRSADETIKKFILFDVRFFNRKVKPILSNNNTILICTNEQDNIEIVKNFAQKLIKDFYIIVRPHPADRRNWAGNYELSKGNSIWFDLEHAKYVLSNESAVFLEGIFADRICYKCAFFSYSLDNYGFIKNGLILKEYACEDELFRDINDNIVTTNKNKLTFFIGQTEQVNLKIKQLHYEISILRN